MRPLGVALVLLFLVPAAAAQVPTVPGGTPLDPVQNPLRLAPGADIVDVRPLTGFGATNLSVQLHCTALSPNAPTEVALAATGPEWLVVTVSPASAVFPQNAPDPATTPPTPPCANEFKVQDVAVIVSATADAPAYQPGLVTITATQGDRTRTAFLNASASARMEITAGADTSNGRASPGKPWTFTITVTNLGNHKADVELVGGAPRGITVDVQGGEVGSRQAGAATNQQTFDVRVTPAATVLNGQYPVWVNATATVADKPNVRASRESVQVSVVVEGAAVPAGEEENALPTPFWLLPLAAGAAVTVRRRR